MPSRVLSRFEKVQLVVQKSFPLIWFSSKEIQSVYEQELKEPVNLSTVSTYLSRMASKGILLRTGGSNNLKFKTATNIPQAILKQRVK
jgi:predicted transcriptional regulator